MFERILVPLDGSANAEVILPQIARILKRENAEILLVRAVSALEGSGKYMHQFLLDREREQAHQYLDDMVRRFGKKATKLQARVVDGPAAEVILQTAQAEGATLIAMTTHGSTGFERWLLGSVAEKVARASAVPVLLVRSFRRSSKGGLEPLGAEALPFRRMLVPVDGSSTSMSVIGPAEQFARLYDSEILLLHVLPPFVPPAALLPGMEASLPITRPDPLPSELDPVTEKAAERFKQSGLNTTRLSVEGDPATVILDLSINREMDLIALGTHGRTGLTRWALGSVAERVLRSAEVPLLLVRTPKPKQTPKKPAPKKARGR